MGHWSLEGYSVVETVVYLEEMGVSQGAEELRVWILWLVEDFGLLN